MRAQRATSHLTVELIPDEDMGGFTARLTDIPAYGEGATEEQALADLRSALCGYIKAFGLDVALARLSHLHLRHIDLDLAAWTREP